MVLLSPMHYVLQAPTYNHVRLWVMHFLSGHLLERTKRLQIQIVNAGKLQFTVNGLANNRRMAIPSTVVQILHILGDFPPYKI
jgi:hypothetical protein